MKSVNGCLKPIILRLNNYISLIAFQNFRINSLIFTFGVAEYFIRISVFC